MNLKRNLIPFFSSLFLINLSVYCADNSDLVYKKENRETPEDINDDHIVVRKISSDEMNTMAVSGGNVYFDFDKADVVPTEHIKIEEIAKAIKKLSARLEKVSLEGFASKDGDTTRNMNLGAERATAVKAALIGEGVPENLIEIISYGERKAFQFENKNKNRRAQIRLYLKK
jgi:outer membrane protein OmpA-like peptidoglycan-associated protein